MRWLLRLNTSATRPSAARARAVTWSASVGTLDVRSTGRIISVWPFHCVDVEPGQAAFVWFSIHCTQLVGGGYGRTTGRALLSGKLVCGPPTFRPEAMTTQQIPNMLVCFDRIRTAD